MKDSIRISSNPAFDQVAAAFRAKLDIHLEVRPKLGDLVIGPLDAVGARFAQTVRILFIGDVDASARLADAEELPEDQLGLVEHLQRMAARDEVELIVLEQHF